MSSAFCSTRSIALMSESGHARRNWSGWVSGACPLCLESDCKLSKGVASLRAIARGA